MADGHNKTAQALRIYEYVDRDGVVFWSFTRLPGTSVRRLSLVDTRGVYYRRHISDIMEMAFASERLKGDG